MLFTVLFRIFKLAANALFNLVILADISKPHALSRPIRFKLNRVQCETDVIHLLYCLCVDSHAFSLAVILTLYCFFVSKFWSIVISVKQYLSYRIPKQPIVNCLFLPLSSFRYPFLLFLQNFSQQCSPFTSTRHSYCLINSIFISIIFFHQFYTLDFISIFIVDVFPSWNATRLENRLTNCQHKVCIPEFLSPNLIKWCVGSKF